MVLHSVCQSLKKQRYETPTQSHQKKKVPKFLHTMSCTFFTYRINHQILWEEWYIHMWNNYIPLIFKVEEGKREEIRLAILVLFFLDQEAYNYFSLSRAAFCGENKATKAQRGLCLKIYLIWALSLLVENLWSAQQSLIPFLITFVPFWPVRKAIICVGWCMAHFILVGKSIYVSRIWICSFINFRFIKICDWALICIQTIVKVLLGLSGIYSGIIFKNIILYKKMKYIMPSWIYRFLFLLIFVYKMMKILGFCLFIFEGGSGSKDFILEILPSLLCK